MTERDLLYRGFSNWENYFWHVMVHAKYQQWESLMEKFEELAIQQQLQCLFYIGMTISNGGADREPAAQALKQLSSIIKSAA